MARNARSDRNSDHRGPPPGVEDGFPARLEYTIGGETIKAFAQRAGLHHNTMQGYLKGDREPPRPALVALAAAGSVSLEWLASGYGSPTPESPLAPDLRRALIVSFSRFRQGPGAEFSIDDAVAAYVRHYNDRDRFGGLVERLDELPEVTEELVHSTVPLRPAAVAASMVDHDASVPDISFDPRFLREVLQVHARRLFLFQVSGAAPTAGLAPGEVVLAAAVAADDPVEDGLYVIDFGDTTGLRRVLRLPTGNIAVSADYPASRSDEYPPREFHKHVKVLGRAIRRISAI